MDSDSDSKPDGYIVPCRTFSTGSDSDPCMESFPNSYCTHFRDGSPSQGQISVPIPYILNLEIRVRIRTSGKICIVQESESESVFVGGNEPLAGPGVPVNDTKPQNLETLKKVTLIFSTRRSFTSISFFNLSSFS